MRRLPRFLVAGLAALSGLAIGAVSSARAQAPSFPTKGKAITIIVPYAAGGVTDTGARLIAAGLEKEFGTPVQVVNKVGAASQVGLTELVRSAPDGYTLSCMVIPTVITHYFDPSRGAIYARKDFQPIAMHHAVPQTLSVQANSPYKTLKDLVEAAKAKPDAIKVSTSGLMAVPHTQVLLLQHATGARFASVHFTGGAPSVTALLGGHVDVLAGATADALQHKNSGAFRVLAVAAEQPDKSMPDVPTMRSLGYDVIAVSATGFVAPAGTPKPVVDTLTAAIKKIIESAEHQQKLTDLGLTPNYLDSEAYSKFWSDTENRVKPVLESIKLP